MSEGSTRVEHDLLGPKSVPADAYYGVQTARALENFHISGVELRLFPDLIAALGMVKLAAARANADEAPGQVSTARSGPVRLDPGLGRQVGFPPGLGRTIGPILDRTGWWASRGATLGFGGGPSPSARP